MATVGGLAEHCEYLGCLVPLADNFDPTATVHAFAGVLRCVYVNRGCTNPSSRNYDALAAIDDGTCAPPAPGCSHPLAMNYDSNAYPDNGSCRYILEGCTDSRALNFFPDATRDDGSCLLARDGCMSPVASNYDTCLLYTSPSPRDA